MKSSFGCSFITSSPHLGHLRVHIGASIEEGEDFVQYFRPPPIILSRGHLGRYLDWRKSIALGLHSNHAGFPGDRLPGHLPSETTQHLSSASEELLATFRATELGARAQPCGQTQA